MNKRILVFHPHFTIAGGAGTFVLEVCSRLKALGFESVILCIKRDSEITKKFDKDLVFVELGGPLSSSLLHWLSLPWFIFKAIKVTKALNPDIIFPQVFPANWWAGLCQILITNLERKPKLVWMCQEPSAFIHSRKWIDAIASTHMRVAAKLLNPSLQIIDKFLAKRTDFVFANSKYGAAYAKQIYNFSEDKLDYVYLGAEKSFFLGDNGPKFNQRKKEIITVCRLTKFKNVDFLINILSELNQNLAEPIKLRIIGKGEEEQSLKQQVKNLGLQDFVFFEGAVSEERLIQALSQSRALVLASVDEPFGLTVVEGLACGAPAIVSNSGGPSEIVSDSVCGYLIPALDKAKFIQAIKSICQDQLIFTELSEKAKTRAKDFDWDKTAQIIAKKFNQI
jgi:glycosyltransferase involved in cell wall biosynthesis